MVCGACSEIVSIDYLHEHEENRKGSLTRTAAFPNPFKLIAPLLMIWLMRPGIPNQSYKKKIKEKYSVSAALKKKIVDTQTIICTG